ncbi:tRNA (guanine(10)-N2)-methyltransferase homolog isoform X2 [Orussus abietinus]|uniref:tRNA (guanine(10)-N2)-methyltransferase homolog isoform X2 n=1 Tax=Orussus abietinus TaxID=222816 RepID=UPI000626C1B5|nr:tRNA (guanine(10)-N2)-methyltransferase homolog isoform X2 [Orussus abietinus]
MNTQWKTYLLWFAHEHVDFRVAEIDSILDMLNINLRAQTKPEDHPYWIIEVPSESVVHEIARRSVTLRFCLELWADGQGFEEFHDNLRLYSGENIKVHINPDKSFRITVETFCKHFTQQQKVEKIESFNYLPLDGPVNLKNPDTSLFYIEYYGLDPNAIPENPCGLFFGRWITDGQRELIQKLSLKTRKFIGNTSMDPQLSLIMANQAQVKEGDMVLDPFVGTGSLLVAASQFGGYTLGTDIDYLMLHGRTRPSRIKQKARSEGECVAMNINQYGKGSHYIDVLVADFSLPLWKSDMRVDSIITDPPYGIREATERLGSIKINPVIEGHQVATHIPSKVEYGLPQLYRDLLSFSAKHLKINGREHYSEDQLPQHSCLSLIANSEQVLSNYTSRRLLTYRKLREPQDSDNTFIMNVTDFREKYFGLRDESRKERRMKRADERLRNKTMWELSKKDTAR